MLYSIIQLSMPRYLFITIMMRLLANNGRLYYRLEDLINLGLISYMVKDLIQGKI